MSAGRLEMKGFGFGEAYTGNISEEPAESLRSAADYDSVHAQSLVCGVNCEIGEDACAVEPVFCQFPHPYRV